MNFQIEIQNPFRYPINEDGLRVAAMTVLNEQGAPANSGLVVVITDNDGVAALNRQFRGIDAPTDVLSFRAGAPPVDVPGEPPYLGDLLIAYPYAVAQAQCEGHALEDDLALLVVHGTLHLLGYDHDTLANRARMWAAQEAALRSLSIALDIVPGLEGDAGQT